MLEVEGKIVKMYDLVVKSEKFKFRQFVLEIQDGNYAQFGQFQVSNDKVSMLDRYKEGDLLKVAFSIRGREWNGKYLTNLEAWRMEPIKGLENVKEYKPEDSDPFKDYPTVEKDIRKDPEFQARMDAQLPF